MHGKQRQTGQAWLFFWEPYFTIPVLSALLRDLPDSQIPEIQRPGIEAKDGRPGLYSGGELDVFFATFHRKVLTSHLQRRLWRLGLERSQGRMLRWEERVTEGAGVVVGVGVSLIS